MDCRSGKWGGRCREGQVLPATRPSPRLRPLGATRLGRTREQKRPCPLHSPHKNDGVTLCEPYSLLQHCAAVLPSRVGTARIGQRTPHPEWFPAAASRGTRAGSYKSQFCSFMHELERGRTTELEGMHAMHWGGGGMVGP